ncbi:MAG: hypothetical protein DRQ44_01510 [Gammaproteobacteria bacterium]|nr:MAG: hypothetical protein DRQ44_01510 [Gammaproteobacteria bacterium]
MEQEHAEGKSVYFGDVLLVIVSIDDFEEAERVVSSLHSAFPGVAVFVRAALLHIDAENLKIELALEHFRSDYYGRINR